MGGFPARFPEQGPERPKPTVTEEVGALSFRADVLVKICPTASSEL